MGRIRAPAQAPATGSLQFDHGAIDVEAQRCDVAGDQSVERTVVDLCGVAASPADEEGSGVRIFWMDARDERASALDPGDEPLVQQKAQGPIDRWRREPPPQGNLQKRLQLISAQRTPRLQQHVQQSPPHGRQSHAAPAA